MLEHQHGEETKSKFNSKGQLKEKKRNLLKHCQLAVFLHIQILQ